MKKMLDRNLLKPYVDMLINRCKFLYGSEYISKIAGRISNIDYLYLSDEMEDYVNMCFTTTARGDSVTGRYIYINKDFAPKDSNGNYLFEFDKTTDFFKHSLIHELLHAASFRKEGSGIVPKDSGAYKKALNEGITQMMADDICGHYQSKFLGSYNLEKIVARIFSVSFGNDLILKTYFDDVDAFHAATKNVPYCDIFWSYFHVALVKYENVDINSRPQRLENILRNVVINVVVPTYNSLSENKRENYLSKIIYCASGDENIRTKLVLYINEYIHRTDDDLQKESNALTEEFVKIDQEGNVLEDLSNLNKFLIRDDGTIVVIGTENKIVDSKESMEKIYTRLFELNGYDKYLTDEVIDKYLNYIKKGKTLKINFDSVLKKRMVYCGIKSALAKRGYLFLNDLEEADKKESFVIEFINRRVDYEDYKKMCENYSLCKTRVGKNEYTYTVIHNSTKNELEDPTLKKMAFYALNWMNCVQDNGRDGIDEAFKPGNMRPFYSIMAALDYVLNSNNNFDINVIMKETPYKSILKKMLETPIQMEWVQDFITSVTKEFEHYQEKRGLSYIETNDPNYLLNQSKETARDIIRRNK